MAPERDEDRALLAIAKEFRDAASAAGRSDVVTKIDEAILLIADPVERPAAGDDKSSIVMRILDGLGF
ncbi:hypothetical protein ACTI_60450 [Actinoplanes sp. OR16]|uniref:hypothetical protein n=1 Tax=Actinoplanes sp. OR16 TaxID=946334 RepID=UPI000F6DA685|nr:hypothetical protein [Actinoplanes sp. OR16]BBH69360.1 hypothetical protein ACTI_60450 [Actinoplanes sp. OR16]